MTKQTLALYGMLRSRPIWFIRLRGLMWLKMGCCPCCYSSPPRPDCMICVGSYKYGPEITEPKRREWCRYWGYRCDRYRVRSGQKS